MANIRELRNIKQAFHRYETWEDYQSGMYHPSNDAELVGKAIEMLSNAPLCRKYMRRVVSELTIAAEEVLTNPESNGRAWLGQCACFMFAGCHDEETRRAWVMLAPAEQRQANKIADDVIKGWLSEYSKRCPNYQMTIFDLEVGM